MHRECPRAGSARHQKKCLSRRGVRQNRARGHEIRRTECGADPDFRGPRAKNGRQSEAARLRTRRTGQRKVITLPRGAEAPCPTESVTSFQRALARGFRWLRMIELGAVGSISETAQREKVDHSYVARMMNLTSLAPDIVAAILDESLPAETALLDLAFNPPVRWVEQRQLLKARS